MALSSTAASTCDDLDVLATIKLRPRIAEECGTDVERVVEMLVQLERHAQDGAAAWMAQASLKGSWVQCDVAAQVAATYAPTPPAARLGEPLQHFCTDMLAVVHQRLSTQLHQLWLALEEASLHDLGLDLAITWTVTRKADEYLNELVHADAFDGTVLAVAFCCNKMGTRLYPDASFCEPPLDQFVRESRTGRRNGYSLVVDSARGEMRVLAPRTLLIMPAAVAHARPDGRVGDHSPAGPRWFARATLELKPQDGPKAWRGRRADVALLVAEHVWGDADFAAAARDKLVCREHDQQHCADGGG